MELTVISTETIKPSSPTPPHLHHLNLSLIDQHTPSIYIRILFFYSSHGDPHRFQATDTSHRLKNSLSEVLTEFYPVAGALDNKRFLHCNDKGVEYIEARVKSPLALTQLLACPKAEELARLVPYDEYNDGTGLQGLAAVQVTVFEECGAMAIGVSMLHQLADASSLALFVNRWASVARRDLSITNNKFGSPVFDCASLFTPPGDHIAAQPLFTPGDDITVQQVAPKLVTRRFVFRQMKTDALKANFVYDSPTRVEAVSALIIKCLINASKSRSSKPIVLCMGINLRGRMNPPLPTHYFGNLALPGRMERFGPELSLNDLGVQIRKVVKEIDGDYLEKLRANNAVLLSERLNQQMEVFMNNDVKVLPATSWCRFPWYEVDVGWGSPTWVAPVYLNSQDSFMLLDAKNDDGIEAWVTLDEEDMARFESDHELLDFACLNPMICESP